MKSTTPSHAPKGRQFPAGMRSPYGWVGEKSLPSSCPMCCGAASLQQASGNLALPRESNGITPTLPGAAWSCSMSGTGREKPEGSSSGPEWQRTCSTETVGDGTTQEPSSKAPHLFLCPIRLHLTQI